MIIHIYLLKTHLSVFFFFFLLDIVSYDFPSLSSLSFPRKNFFLGILA